jgi:prepilin peptidase CpaA
LADPSIPLVLCLASVTGVAAITDMRSRIIPNWLCATGILAGFVLQISLHGWSGAMSASSGFGLALAIYVPLFLLRAMGGGDVKLMAAVGALAGPNDWFAIFLLASVLGGLFAFAVLVLRSRLGTAFGNVAHILTNLSRLRAPWATRPDLDISDSRALTIPHGVAIAAGTFVFLFGR